MSNAAAVAAAGPSVDWLLADETATWAAPTATAVGAGIELARFAADFISFSFLQSCRPLLREAHS